MKQDISQKKVGIDFGSYDSIVIKKHITDIEGGRTLDVTDFPESVILAGHVIISKVANNEKVYLPMPIKQVLVNNEPQVDEEGNKVYAYDTLPTGASYEGILYRSILTEKPAASILIDGVVNDEVMKIKLGTIESAFKAACPHIIFNHDEEA